MDLSIFATQPTYQLNSLFKPITQEVNYVQSNEYFQFEDIQYLPIRFDLLSLAINKVDRFKSIPIDKWINSGYKYPLEETYNNVNVFLSSLPDIYLYNLDTENIEPTSYGTFVLDFISNNNKLSIEIGKEKIGYFTDFINQDNLMSEGVNFNDQNVPWQIFEVFEKML